MRFNPWTTASGTPRITLGRRTLSLIKGFFTGSSRREAWSWLAMLLGLCAGVGVVQVFLSYAMRDFVTALSQYQREAWIWSIQKYAALCLLSVPIGTLYRYVQERLSLVWRRWMTQHLLRRYFLNRAYYRFRIFESIDNPDQRIAEDVRFFTTGALNYFLVFINSTVTLVAFVGVLWTISGRLVAAILIYATVGTAITLLFGRKLVGLHFDQFKREATFRHGLIRIHENAESIAFYRGEGRERRHLLERFAEVFENTLWVIGWNRNLGLFVNGYNYLALILPAVIVGPMFLRGQIAFGVVTQAEGAFAQVLLALSLVVVQMESLSTLAASVRRLADLWDHLDYFDAEDKREAEETEIEVKEKGRQLNLKEVTLQTPRGDKTLARDLAFHLRPGGSLLVMGESGAGKSSLLRTIAGLWQTGSGSIERPAHKHLMFLPQKPYMVYGSLRAQLMYPMGEHQGDDDEIRAIFPQVNLQDILDRVDGDLDKIVDWENVLSLGEQQRVAFARLFLKKPTIGFFDEATSALDEENERFLYERLRDSGIGYISVGHRSSLKEFHDLLLVLHRDGSSELTKLRTRES
jgi:putative ATP-binding cassette transporter